MRFKNRYIYLLISVNTRLVTFVILIYLVNNHTLLLYDFHSNGTASHNRNSNSSMQIHREESEYASVNHDNMANGKAQGGRQLRSRGEKKRQKLKSHDKRMQ